MIDGKSVLITGAAQGIGAEFAESFARMGAKVTVADVISPDDVVTRIKEAGGEAIGCVADVTKLEDCEKMVANATDTFGGLDGLVCNAAMFSSLPAEPYDQISPDLWDKVMAVNVKGPWLCTRAAVSAMGEGGSIVMIGTNRVLRGYPMMLHYDASKGAVHAMTRSLIRELGPQNIRVNTVLPGLTMSEGVLAREGIQERAPEIANARSLARDQQPQDLVGAVAWFLSDHSAFVTGQSLVVDGGGMVQ
ncbi:MAG: SDR family oxidoreductase [Pseudomonadota bacterium]